MMSIRAIHRENGTVEYHVVDVGGWEEFESLAKYLRKSFGAKIVEQTDGICSRTCSFMVGNEAITLKHHDDIGNWFFSNNGDSKLIAEIAEDLERRLQ